MDEHPLPRKPRLPEQVPAPAKGPTGVDPDEYQGEPYAVAVKKSLSALAGTGPDRAVGRSAQRLYQGFLERELQVPSPSLLALAADWAVSTASAQALMAAANAEGLTSDRGMTLAKEARQWSQRSERILCTLKTQDRDAAAARKTRVIDVGKTLEERFGK